MWKIKVKMLRKIWTDKTDHLAVESERFAEEIGTGFSCS